MTTNLSIRKKKNCSPSIPTPLSFFHPSLVPFIFSPHFIFSPFDCHRFIQLSFTDKRARSHRLYRRAAIECSLPFLFNAYSINWRGITSNDFIGRWIKQIMPARKVDNVDKRGEIVFRRIEYGREKREEREEERERATICEAPFVKRAWRTCFFINLSRILLMFQGHLSLFSPFFLSFVYSF